MSKCKLLLIITTAYLLFSIPAMGEERGLALPGATNGTIGPKSRIETPLESSIKGYRMPTSGTVKKLANLHATKEVPGLVNWHDNLQDACKASFRSGKPVLLLHILGNLDDHFC